MTTTETTTPGLPVRIREGLGVLARHEAHRYRFAFDQLEIRLWGRVRVLPWALVRSARLAATSTRRVRLHLTFDSGRVVRVPLTSYHGSARLLADIERRLPVAVATSQALQAALEKAG